MGQFDPAMSSLFASMMMPQAAVQSQGIAGSVLDDMQKRQRAKVATAKPQPMQPQPITQHLNAQPRDGHPVVNASNGQSAAYQTPPPMAHPAAVQQAPVREQDFNPAGVTLGDQPGGGRNVELIRGGQSSVQHFNQQGDNTGTLPNAQPGTGAAPAQAAIGKGQPTWKDYQKQDQSQYDHNTRQLGSLEKQIEFQTKQTGKADPALVQQHAQLIQQNASLGGKLYDPKAVQNYQAITDPTVAQGVNVGEVPAERQVQDASATMHQPVQMPQTAFGNKGYNGPNVSSQHAAQQILPQARAAGIPPAPEPGRTRLTSSQANTLRQLHPDPNAVAQAAMALGYDISEGPFAEEEQTRKEPFEGSYGVGGG